MASEADEGSADGRCHGQKDKEVQCVKQELFGSCSIAIMYVHVSYAVIHMRCKDSAISDIV